MKKLYHVIFLFTISTSSLFAQWAEETLATLTLEQKVGQLFMIPAVSDDVSKKSIERYMPGKSGITEEYYQHLIRDKYIGGLIFFKGNPVKQIEIVNKAQSWGVLPLLVGQDCEWGLDMRLEGVINFPKHMTLGAIQDDDVIYRVGKMIGQQCRMIGVHVNFAPVVDVNYPHNPIIGVRSFGENKELVAHKSLVFSQGLQDGGVFACAKHFPGHGKTNVDSHLDLPVLELPVQEMTDELYPFKVLIDGGVDAVMMAHISVPLLDSSYIPSSLSRPMVTDVLRTQLGFDGLVFTDAMVMKALSSFFKPAQASVQAVIAGNDVLLYPMDIEGSMQAIADAVKSGLISEKELDQHVLRILRAKERLGLHQQRMTDAVDIQKRLHSGQASELKKLAFQKAITVVRNESSFIPFKNLEPSKVGIVDFDAPKKYSDATVQLGLNATEQEMSDALQAIKDASTVVVRIFKASIHQGFFGKVSDLAPSISSFLGALEQQDKNVVIVLCTSPYALAHLPSGIPTVVAYEPDDDALAAAMDVAWGRMQAEGVLPISLPTTPTPTKPIFCIS